MRSIHLLHHSISPFQGQFPEEDALHYNTGIPMQFARAIRQHIPEHQVEVWRPEHTLVTPYVWQDDDDITHRVFPSRYLRYKVEISPGLLDAVKQLAHERETCIWVHGIYNLHAHLFSRFLTNSAAIGQSHGGLPAKGMFSISQHRWLRYLYLPLQIVEKASLPKYPYLFVISRQEDKYLQEMASIPPERTRFSPTGIDFELFSPGDLEAARTACGLDDQTRALLYVGRLAPEKGIEYLIQAFAHIARDNEGVDLFVIGSGPLDTSLKTQVCALGLTERVHFLGYVSQQALPNWYRAADLTVMPSLHEWFGKVAAESMACATPVIATDAGGAIDIVREFQCGTLVSPQSVSELVEAIRTMLAGRANTTPNIERAREAFDWSSKLSTAFELFEKMADAQA